MAVKLGVESLPYDVCDGSEIPTLYYLSGLVLS